MIFRNTQDRYGAVAKGFHWTIGLLILGLLALGLYMANADLAPPVRLPLYFYHKSFGIVVLTLAVLRLGWRFVNARPAALPQHKSWEKILARLVHGFLYVAMLGMPLSGWVMSSAKGYGVSVFGLFTLPNIVPENQAIFRAAANFHETAAYILMGLLVLHVAGALKHHFMDHDNTLRRMLPGAGLLLIPLAAGALVLAGGHPTRAQAPTAAEAPCNGVVPQWFIVPEKSTLTFEGTQMGAPFTGRFARFDGQIFFDPDHLCGSSADVTIDMKSADTKSSERDSYLPAADWFDTASFPESKFRTVKIEAARDAAGKPEPGRYIAHGTLTLKGVALPVDLPFSLSFSGGDATGSRSVKMDGTATLQRLDFKVGTGQWADTKSVDNRVTVTVSIEALDRPAAAR